MAELLFSHKIAHSFLSYGFTISIAELERNKALIDEAYKNKQKITIIFEGAQYTALFDNLNRLMFRTELVKAFQDYFKDYYKIVKGRNDKDKIVVDPSYKKIVGFFSTKDKFTLEARVIDPADYDLNGAEEKEPADPNEMRAGYEAYLISLGGKFAGYVKAIDKDFVKETVGELYGLPSAYCITSSKDILELVEHIRSDEVLNQKDLDSSSRCPSCSLKKYAEYLQTLEKDSSRLPFDIDKVIATIADTGLIFDPMFVKRYVCALLTKPFVILSGLTGSGKTQLALKFAELICRDESQYTIVPVGADWTNRDPLLGYPNAIQPGKYVTTDVLNLMIEADKPENQDKPYFLLLDEMNMSYVERYFADFLSVMESNQPIPLHDDDKITEAPKSIKLPKNLFIVGTINVDETTYMFSPKVLDRANVIEFRISKDQMAQYFQGTVPIKPVEKCHEYAADFVAKATKEYGSTLSDSMKNTLLEMFGELGKVQKEFGYRTAREMSRFVAIAQSLAQMDEKACIDSAMVQKLLPKVHGSRKKITPILKTLWKICQQGDAAEIDTFDTTPDFNGFKYPLTAEKIWRMFLIAQDNGFTSFAEA